MSDNKERGLIGGIAHFISTVISGIIMLILIALWGIYDSLSQHPLVAFFLVLAIAVFIFYKFIVKMSNDTLKENENEENRS